MRLLVAIARSHVASRSRRSSTRMHPKREGQEMQSMMGMMTMVEDPNGKAPTGTFTCSGDELERDLETGVAPDPSPNPREFTYSDSDEMQLDDDLGYPADETPNG